MAKRCLSKRAGEGSPPAVFLPYLGVGGEEQRPQIPSDFPDCTQNLTQVSKSLGASSLLARNLGGVGGEEVVGGLGEGSRNPSSRCNGVVSDYIFFNIL